MLKLLYCLKVPIVPRLACIHLLDRVDPLLISLLPDGWIGIPGLPEQVPEINESDIQFHRLKRLLQLAARLSPSSLDLVSADGLGLNSSRTSLGKTGLIEGLVLSSRR